MTTPCTCQAGTSSPAVECAVLDTCPKGCIESCDLITQMIKKANVRTLSEYAVDLTAAIGFPVKCPHCPDTVAPVSPAKWKDHVEQHHDEDERERLRELHEAHGRIEARLARDLLRQEQTLRRVEQALEDARRLGCTGDGYHTMISRALNAEPGRRERKG